MEQGELGSQQVFGVTRLVVLPNDLQEMVEGDLFADASGEEGHPQGLCRVTGMRITVAGAGMVGSALCAAWAKRNHEITLAVRDQGSDSITQFESMSNVTITGISPSAVEQADLVVLAVSADQVVDVAQLLGGLANKAVLDPTNPLSDDFSSLTVGMTTSNAERLAHAIPDANVVKAFNTIGAHFYDSAEFGGETPSMFVAGDDENSKQVVSGLAEELGFEPIDCGALVESRLLEPLALLWIRMSYVQQAGDIAFRLIRN